MKDTDGWMTCHYTSFSAVFQSFSDDGRVMMKVFMCIVEARSWL